MTGLLQLATVLGLGALIYAHQTRMRSSHLPLLALLFSFLFFISRFNLLVHVKLMGHPLMAVHLYVLALTVVLFAVRALGSRPYSSVLVAPLAWLALYAVVSLLSGLVNGGVAGIGAALQVVLITVGPALLAWTVVELMPRNIGTTVILTRHLILVLGLITPLILLVSALRPEIFANVLGWGAFIDWGEGFLRGWSPLGSTIVTGCLVVLAFGLALHEAVVFRSRLHLAVAVLAATSILFTAARSVMVIFVVFNLVYWVMLRRWRLFFRFALVPGVAMGAVVLWSVVGGVNFDRFLMTSDFSTMMRVQSVREALAQGLSSPLLGRGPGLLYHEMRNEWVYNESGIPLVKERIVGTTLSAMEPHNLYAYLIAEHGLVAAAAFVAAFALLLLRLRRTPVGGDLTAQSRRAAFTGIWISLLLIFNTASWPLVNTHFSFFFWLLVFGGLHWSLHAGQAEDGS